MAYRSDYLPPLILFLEFLQCALNIPNCAFYLHTIFLYQNSSTSPSKLEKFQICSILLFGPPLINTNHGKCSSPPFYLSDNLSSASSHATFLPRKHHFLPLIPAALRYILSETTTRHLQARANSCGEMPNTNQHYCF